MTVTQVLCNYLVTVFDSFETCFHSVLSYDSDIARVNVCIISSQITSDSETRDIRRIIA